MPNETALQTNTVFWRFRLRSPSRPTARLNAEETMLSSKLWALAVACAASCVAPTGADDKPAGKPLPEYVRLSAEIRGTLQVEKDAIRVRVFLAGSCLVVFYDVWELDFGTNDELKAAAKKLNGGTVVVTGDLPSRNLVGLGGKPPESRQIISIKTLTAAPAK